MALFSTFRRLRRFISPRWLSEGQGGLVGLSLDYISDAFMARALSGLMVGYPQNGPNGETAPTDALTIMGRDRRVWRGIFDTDTEYAAKLVTWLSDRQSTGGAFALLKQLHAYVGTNHGVSFRTVDAHGNWFSRSAGGVETYSLDTGNWLWDGAEATRWSRFWVVLFVGSLWTAEATWGVGLWGDTGGTWGSTATPEQAQTLRAIVADGKPAGTNFNIILALDPSSFDPTAPEPDGLWGKWFKYVAGDAIASRLSTGRYFGA